jgi:hypothetical protein
MKRRNLFLGLGLILAVLLTCAFILGLLLRHEKAYYVHLTPPRGAARKQDSRDCFTKLAWIFQDIETLTPKWAHSFEQNELNSYFCEDFETSGVSEKMLPEYVRDPRVSLEDDGIIQVGFHYGKSPWQTLISVRLRVWLASEEPNSICLEVLNVQAGGLSISGRSVMEKVFEGIKKQNVEVAWYSCHGHDTAVLRFQSDQPHPAIQLTELQISSGKLEIGGKSTESTPAQ